MLTHKIVKKCKSDIEFKCLCWELWHGWGSPGALWIPEGKQIPTITMRSRAIIKFTKRKVFSWCTSTLHLPTFHSFRRKKLSPYLHLKSFASRKKKMWNSRDKNEESFYFSLLKYFRKFFSSRCNSHIENIYFLIPSILLHFWFKVSFLF